MIRLKQSYERQILHIDMNSFFASCEQIINPELREKPLVVGGDPEKRSGIVLAASYDAKRCGVKTTMTLREAAKLCPNANFVKSTPGLYDKISKKVMEVFHQYTPLVEQLSIDEAFLDMTGTDNLFGDIFYVAETIQNRILQELELPCSVGISSNKLLAKMASDYKKPMGITSIYPHETQDKLWPLEASYLYGVGKKSVIKLNQIGVSTIGQLAQANIDVLITHFGNSFAQTIHRYANGIDDSPVEPIGEPIKSMGNEITFPKDLTNTKDIFSELLVLADKVGYRLRKKNLKGRTISIKVKFLDFTVITRAKTIDTATDSTDRIYQLAKDLIIENQMKKPIRLLGITVSKFEVEEVQQLSFFQNNTSTNKLDHMVDEIRKKYGYHAVKRATNLGDPDNIKN